MADLHISNRLPTRKEFIVDVSKRLYINSDFIFSYTSDNEYAIRAIRRADILWKELVKANVIEDSKTTQRPIPEVIYDDSNKWWKDDSKLQKFATIMELDLSKLRKADDSVFAKIDSLFKTNNFVKTTYLSTATNFFDNGSKVLTPTITKITTENRSYALADMFNVTHSSFIRNPQVLSSIKTITSPYSSNITLSQAQEFEKIGIKV